MEDKFKKYNDLVKQCEAKYISENDRFNKLNEEITLMLNAFSFDEGESMITYQTLAGLEFDKWFPVNDGVKFKRIFNPNKPVFYITEMDPSATTDGVAIFGTQKHDCKELCTVIEGELIEGNEGNKKYVTGDIVIYPTDYLHKPKAKVFSKYLVEFINPNK
ncbi:MAG: Unknown protein [uncultured Sulfurovum sp.]|uniref:Uncharacterized protein n=1 Tax=uncultured Sulfurovum sp. TaxID=269237 RepID=A0A6S6T4Z4_9BACT|nr:MAG: Unknown protein [uncultured Sulfurovum sp.]